MTKHCQQIFVQSADSEQIMCSLQEYIKKNGKRFIQCSSFRLEGVVEILNTLVKKKREFRLYTDDEWTVVWEIIDHTDFADPSVAKFLSEHMTTDSIWIKFDLDYNIWAFQEFHKGRTISETFLPASYFRGEAESEHRYDYGSCLDVAELFNASKLLPLFLESSMSILKKPALSRNLKSISCKLSNPDD